jgi:antibiotic biosynthesis monooxygenase (ABM) superfamily enzyme
VVTAVVEYEVSLSVDAGLGPDYLDWLRDHVAAMLALPGFLGAELARVLEPLPPGRTGWCVRYRLRDAAALAAYLAQHAPAMRAQGEARFGARVQASRRVLEPIPAAAGDGAGAGP